MIFLSYKNSIIMLIGLFLRKYDCQFLLYKIIMNCDFFIIRAHFLLVLNLTSKKMHDLLLHPFYRNSMHYLKDTNTKGPYQNIQS